VYHDRIGVWVFSGICGRLSSGRLSSSTEFIDQWGADKARKAIEVADLHERRTGRGPGQTFLCSGHRGSAPTGLPAIKILCITPRHTQIVGFTSPRNMSGTVPNFAAVERENTSSVALLGGSFPIGSVVIGSMLILGSSGLCRTTNQHLPHQKDPEEFSPFFDQVK